MRKRNTRSTDSESSSNAKYISELTSRSRRNEVTILIEFKYDEAKTNLQVISILCNEGGKGFRIGKVYKQIQCLAEMRMPEREYTPVFLISLAMLE